MPANRVSIVFFRLFVPHRQLFRAGRGCGLISMLLGSLLYNPTTSGEPLPSPAAMALPAPTRIARPPLEKTPVTNGSIEAPALAAGTFKYNSGLTVAEKAALVWTLAGGAAVSSNGSAFTSQNPNAPSGSQVAVLQGVASMTIQHTFPYGLTPYRVRYRAAQRVMGTTLNTQRVRIKVNGVEVAVETPVQPAGAPLGAYAEFVSRPFEVPQVSSTYPHGPTYSVQISTDNAVGGSALFIDDVRIERLRQWNDSNSWFAGNGVSDAPEAPSAADHVAIPAERVIVIRDTSPKAGTIAAEGELLVADQDSSLEARAVIIMGVGGRFEAGREEVPFKKNFTLTLKGGNAAAENLAGAGTNVLMAMGGGWIDLHGAPRESWTKLSAAAAAGATQMDVTGTPGFLGWGVGDQIVVAPTGRIPDQRLDEPIRQCEVRTITSVAAMGANTRLGLDTALGYPHTNLFRTYPDEQEEVPDDVPLTVDERAEVGLLTHNVRIQGDGSPTGGHVMIMKGMTGCTLCETHGGGFGRVSNVQFHKMGQKQRLGRYPFHWHMVEAGGAGQFIRDCSILNSFNRVLSIHGTDSVVVEGNVAYDHIGHGIFLEDGGEENNEITNNLVLGTRMAALQPAHIGGPATPTDAQELLDFTKNEAVIRTDNSHHQVQNRCPAAFWITNPKNTIVGNIAAGTMGTGFWFALPAKPRGLSADSPYFNTRVPYTNNLGSFTDNTAHSCMSGIDVNDSIAPDTLALLTNYAWVPSVPAHFEDFHGYANSLAIYSGLGADQRDKIFYDRCVLADNDTHIRLADYGTVQKSLIVANSGSGVQVVGPPTRILYQPYDGAGRVKSCHIIGFNTGSYVTLFNSGGSATNHPNHLFEALTYADGNGGSISTRPRLVAANHATADTISGIPQAANHWGVVVRDADGSTARVPGRTNLSLVSNHRMMRTVSDLSYVNVDPNVISNVHISDKRFALLYFRYPNAAADFTNPSQFYPTNPDVKYTRTGGAAGELEPIPFTDVLKNLESTQMPVILSGAQPPVTYQCEFPSVPPGSNPVKLVLMLRDLAPGDISPILKIGGAGIPVSAVTVGSLNAMSYATLTGGAPTASGYYRDASDNFLYVRLVNPAGSMDHTITVNLSW